LLFAEHRLFLGSETPEQTVVRLRLQCPERKLVVEVSSRAEAEIWAQAGVDVLQLEKLPPAEVAAVVQMSERYPQRPVVAVAGGVSFANAEAYAATGAQVLVSSAPYQAPPKDVQVTFVTS
jgi:molybdenum transport protein